jgi:hypothetical protein
MSLLQFYKEYQAIETPELRHRWLDEHRSDLYEYDIKIDNIINTPVTDVVPVTNIVAYRATR